MTTVSTKTYRLSGGTAGCADLTEDGFGARVEGQWYSPEVSREAMKQLMRRSGSVALRHFGLWLGLLIASGITAFLTWGTLWCVPAFAVYGVLYAASDHRAHELSHGTPFKTRWLKEALYHLNAFMTLHEGVYWRWSHSRHHTDTIIVGRDPEIAVPRPPDILGIVLDPAYREIIPALLRQRREPGWHVVRALPSGAMPFRPEPALAAAA